MEKEKAANERYLPSFIYWYTIFQISVDENRKFVDLDSVLK